MISIQFDAKYISLELVAQFISMLNISWFLVPLQMNQLIRGTTWNSLQVIRLLLHAKADKDPHRISLVQCIRSIHFGSQFGVEFEIGGEYLVSFPKFSIPTANNSSHLLSGSLT